MHASATSRPTFVSSSTRFNPPANVKRWTGRAVPTILLPCLASLRLEAPSRAPHATGLHRSRN